MAEHTHNTDLSNEEELTVTLTLDNDEEVDCAVICIYPVGKQEYIALLPLDENGEEKEDGDVYLYKYSEVDDQPVIDNIDSDEEYDIAADAFDEWLDEQEFEEIQGQLDED